MRATFWGGTKKLKSLYRLLTVKSRSNLSRGKSTAGPYTDFASALKVTMCDVGKGGGVEEGQNVILREINMRQDLHYYSL